MHRDLTFIQIVDDQCKCVYATSGHPKIKTTKIVVTISRLGNTCKSMLFWTISSNTFSTIIEQDGKTK
jgi:hypothetical protein